MLELEWFVMFEVICELLVMVVGVEVCDDFSVKFYFMFLIVSGKYDVEVGCICQSFVFDGGIELFVVGD